MVTIFTCRQQKNHLSVRDGFLIKAPRRLLTQKRLMVMVRVYSNRSRFNIIDTKIL
jgi:hypothetical protein